MPLSNLVKNFLKFYGFTEDNVNSLDPRGNPPLLIAVNSNDETLVADLLQAGADPCFVAEGLIDSDIRQRMIDVAIGHSPSPEAGLTLLHAAIMYNSAILERLLHKGARAVIDNRVGAGQITAINLAAREGKQISVITLLAFEANANIPCHKGMVPLHYAVIGDQLSMLEALAKTPGIEPNHASTQGLTPLHIAAYEGKTKFVEILLTIPSICLNTLNGSNRSALLLAAERGHLTIARRLIIYLIEQTEDTLINENRLFDILTSGNEPALLKETLMRAVKEYAIKYLETTRIKLISSRADSRTGTSFGNGFSALLSGLLRLANTPNGQKLAREIAEETNKVVGVLELPILSFSYDPEASSSLAIAEEGIEDKRPSSSPGSRAPKL